MSGIINKESFKIGEYAGRMYANPTILWSSIAAIGVGLFSLAYVSKQNKKYNKLIETKKKWMEERDKLVQERDDKIKIFLTKNKITLSDERIMQIVVLSASELAKEIKERRISAVEALMAYIIRSSTIGKDMFYIADVDFENALLQAKETDKKIKSGEKLSYLTGVPICIKDLAQMKGVINSVGYISRGRVIPEKDCELVRVLRKHGAIPFISSNVPQGVFTIDNSCKLWGNSLNPWNKAKTTGGSSGGDAGLVASGCSALGIGSDIAGSIRVPSNFCGLYGFKPSEVRISRLGTFSLFPGSPVMRASYGPIARSVDDCVLVAKSFYGNFEDYNVDGKSFDEEIYNKYKHSTQTSNKNTKIAYITDINYCETAMSIKESLFEVIESLTSKGYETIQIEYPEELIKLAYKIALNSGGVEDVLETLQGEEPEQFYDDVVLLRSLNSSQISSLQQSDKSKGEDRKAEFAECCKQLTRSEFIETTKKFFDEKSKFIKYLQENKIEAVICPVIPFPAADLNTGNNIFKFTHYTFLFNALDMPAGHIPLKLNKNLEYNSKYNDSLSKMINDFVKTSKDLPIGIQVATLPKQDEKCLALMHIIDEVNRFDKNHFPKVFEKLNQAN